MSNENDLGKKDDPFAMNQKNLKNDIIHFKDDILKDMKTMQKNLAEKFDMSNSLLMEKLEAYDRKINLFNEKIVQISNLVINDKDLKEKIDKLFQGKIELKDHILTNEIKLTNLEKEYHERVSKIEYVLSDSVIYPNVVGPKGKYKTFHELIDFILFQLNQNIVYREKNQLDVTSYKNKLENISQSLKMQLDNIIKSTNEFTTKSVNDVEERIKGILSLYDDRFKGVRVENQNYIKNLEQFFHELKEDFKRLVNMKNNLYNRFSAEVYNIKRDNVQVVKLFGNYKKEFNLMKDRLTKLSEFIKDVRFRINVGQETKRSEFYNMANRIDFTKKQNLDDNISSGIKKYINGEINAEQLASTSKKRLTRANIGYFGNVSNLNNKMNLEDDLNNEDSLNSINNYLMKNKNFFDFENNNNNTNYSTGVKPQLRNSMIPTGITAAGRRKSVNTMMNSFSTNNVKNNNISNQTNQNPFQQTQNPLINNDFKDADFIKPLNIEKRMAQSSESKGRKRYQSVFSNDKNASFETLQLKYNAKEFNTDKSNSNRSNKNSNSNNTKNNNKMNNIELEDSKLSNDRSNLSNIAKNLNYERNIIKEEEESNSKLSESESVISEEQKTNIKIVKKNANLKESSDNKNINSINNIKKINNTNNINNSNNTINTNNANNKNNVNNITPIKPNNNFKYEDNLIINKNKNTISHNSNINLNTFKKLGTSKEIKEYKENEKDDLSQKRVNDKKPNNNIVINCDNIKIENKPIIIEKEYLNNNNNKKQENNNKPKSENKKIIIEDKSKNNQINMSSQTKNANTNKDEKMKFSQTSINFGPKSEKYILEANNNKISSTIEGGEYKSFKGKKYNFPNQSLVTMIKENLIPTESQTIFNNKNKNKKNIIKVKNYNNNNNNYNYYNNYNNIIEFNKDDKGPKHYKNISVDDKKSDAKLIQKMVNNLQSYISNYTSGVENEMNTMYRNKNNFIFKEMSNSYYGGNSNNNYYSNSSHKNRENIIQLKLK